MTMADGGFELDPADEAQWNAIVSSEWPEAELWGPIRVDLALAPLGESAAGAQQTLITIYRARRPAPGPLAAAVVAASVAVWLVIAGLIPAYQLATARGVSRHGRADDIYHLTVDALLVALAIALAAGCVAAWIVMYSRYRLRRSSYDQVTSTSTPRPRHLRPPNPATAAAWLLLLLSTSGVAGWWISLQLERASGIGYDPLVATQSAAIAALTWLVLFVLCVAGTTVWAARETRHRLRHTANLEARQ